jgi:hypothetical protein
VQLPFSKNLVVLASLLAVPVSLQLEHIKSPKPAADLHLEAKVRDARAIRLHQFLAKLHCPVKDMAEHFVHVADDNNLDWRLLPSISVIESGGGKAYRNNNILGWANGDRSFPTIRAGISQVAFKLGNSLLYRNRNTEEKLRIYNPNEDYPGRVEDVMRRISPVVDLRLASSEQRTRRVDPELLSLN